MNEYETRVKNFANGISEIRSSTGATSMTLMFAMLSVMLAKNKLTDKDLEIIFSVEKDQAKSTMQSYFDQGYGEDNFEINNKEELKLAEKYLLEFIDNIVDTIKNTAKVLKPDRKKKE